jgi:hypothetical protein
MVALPGGRMSRFNTATLALLLVPASLAVAGPQTLWDFAPSSQLRRVPAEKGAQPNGQPLKVDAATLARTLASVSFMVKSREEPLFVPAEAVTIADALAEALALAQPGEDLELLSTLARTRGLFAPTRSVTARVFAQDGKVNLIVRDARLEILFYPSLSDHRMPKIDFGSRAKGGDVVLKAPGAETRRADWLVLPLEAMAPAPVPQPVANPASVPQPVANPAPAAQPSARSASIEDHLRDLKRFREQDLITEEEYAKQKAELLKSLSSDVAGAAK